MVITRHINSNSLKTLIQYLPLRRQTEQSCRAEPKNLVVHSSDWKDSNGTAFLRSTCLCVVLSRDEISRQDLKSEKDQSLVCTLTSSGVDWGRGKHLDGRTETQKGRHRTCSVLSQFGRNDTKKTQELSVWGTRVILLRREGYFKLHQTMYNYHCPCTSLQVYI